MSGKIKVAVCPACGQEYEADRDYCFNHPYPTRPLLDKVVRDKRSVKGDYFIVDWFVSRTSAGLVLQHVDTEEQFRVFMGDLFPLLEGYMLEGLTLEEVKKGTAYGWRVVSEDETN